MFPKSLNNYGSENYNSKILIHEMKLGDDDMCTELSLKITQAWSGTLPIAWGRLKVPVWGLRYICPWRYNMMQPEPGIYVNVGKLCEIGNRYCINEADMSRSRNQLM